MDFEKYVSEEFETAYWDIINEQNSYLLNNNEEYKKNNKRMIEICAIDDLGKIIDGESSRTLSDEESKLISEYIRLTHENETIMNKQLLMSGIKLERNFRKLINENN